MNKKLSTYLLKIYIDANYQLSYKYIKGNLSMTDSSEMKGLDNGV